MSKRNLAATVLLASSARLIAADPHADLHSRLDKAIRAFPGVMGISVKNLNTGETLSVNGDTRFPTASLIKVAVMVEGAMAQQRQGMCP